MTAEKVLDIARRELGNTESPAGSNRTKYGKWFGLDGYAWCMMFVMWVFAQAGALGLLPKKTASCGDLMRAAKAAGQWVTKDYRPGDVVIYDFPGGAATDHTGIIERVMLTGVMAIEGNTSQAGSQSNGGMVCRKTRPYNQIVGVVRPKFEEDDMSIDKGGIVHDTISENFRGLPNHRPQYVLSAQGLQGWDHPAYQERPNLLHQRPRAVKATGGGRGVGKVTIYPDNLPANLRDSGLFCCWRYEDRNGKRTKVPYNPKTQGRAQNTNPATFSPLAATLETMERGGYDGIGVGVFGSLGAIDIDHCVDDNGQMSEFARDVAAMIHGYTEFSPSRQGLRILFTVPEGFQYDKVRRCYRSAADPTSPA